MRLNEWDYRLIYTQSISAGVAIFFLFVAMLFDPMLWIARASTVIFVATAVVLTVRVVQLNRSRLRETNSSELENSV